MWIIRAVFPAFVAFALLFAVVTHPSEMFVALGSLVLTLSTASSIIFFAFVAMAVVFGFERTSGRHMAPASPVHVHRSLRSEINL
ncbi:hypothetical protein V5F29_03975 [Xanthobacter aminoxidans]|jgi:hypothetical protein|uniref:hypothetical protein n=1 Tax=Xanthobacter aminoxidans TaxID=186280 RepID=UPI00372CB218